MFKGILAYNVYCNECPNRQNYNFPLLKMIENTLIFSDIASCQKHFSFVPNIFITLTNYRHKSLMFEKVLKRAVRKICKINLTPSAFRFLDSPSSLKKKNVMKHMIFFCFSLCPPPPFNSSCPRVQNIKCLCYSQSKNRLHRKPLYFVMSIVGTGNREGKFE